jgi:Ca-activated chloride channel family protein
MIDSLLNIDWNEFHFLRPQFLWLILPLALILIVGLIVVREPVGWKRHIAIHLRPFVIKKGSEVMKRWMQLITFLVLSIAVVGLAGPSWEKFEQPERILETPMVILLDLSQSMMATDLQPNRLERAKFKISDLIEANPRVRTALVGFAGTAHTLVPLTNDYRIVESNLKGITTGILPFQGSDLEAGLILADSLMKVTEAPGTLLLISDGFDEEVFEQLQDLAIQGNTRIEILPMGTAVGSEFPALGSSRYVRDPSGKPIIAAIDTSLLQKLNTVEGINVNALTLDNSDVVKIAETVRKELEYKDKIEETEEKWKDAGLLFVLPFAFFVLLWFRKGWVIYSIFMVLVLGSCSSESSFKDLWTTDDYKAQQYFDSGNYEEAAPLFTDHLRKGIAYYKAEDYTQAIQSFEMDTSAQGRYNLGLAYYKIGNLNSAKQAFDMAVSLDASFTNASINASRTTAMIASQRSEIGEVEEASEDEAAAENIQNSDPEDLGGGGQEATDEDMKKERKEETVATDIRKGKELEEVPDEFEGGKQDESQKILMRKVDDDPAIFLKRKFRYQVKVKQIKPKEDQKKW